MTVPKAFVFSAPAILMLLPRFLPGSTLLGQDVRTPQTVRVDFMALGKDGQPVTDLKLEDVTLRIDNKLRQLRTLQYVKMSDGLNAAAMATAAATGGTTPTSGPAVPPATDLAPPFAMNLAPPV